LRQIPKRISDSIKYFNIMFRAPLKSLSIEILHELQENLLAPFILFIKPQFPHVLLVYSSLQIITFLL
ncbi:hypothetical protein C2G38_2057835, partial [Gigaspora rosea]